MYLLYNAILALAALIAFPYYGIKMLLTGKYRRSMAAKFGRFSPGLDRRLAGRPRIWIHAVSVGEVTAAAPILAAVREDCPEACIVLSTSTETGRAMAERIVTGATALLYYPLDIPAVVRRVLAVVQPDLFVAVETEIWPNFLRLCRQAGGRLVLVNGRISPRSFRHYRLTRFFWKGILRQMDRIGVISELDARRLAQLGMDPGRVQVLGNAKYDGLASRVNDVLRAEVAQALNLDPGERIFVAGSTHEGEEEAVLWVYRRLLDDDPAFRLILVPRHIERGGAVAALAREAGFPDTITMREIQRGRRRQDERVIVVDVIGELFKLYSLATVAFCGGSLVSRGGQNILEAAAWGKVVFHGPFMEDFREERKLLRAAGAGVTVKNAEELLAGIRRFLAAPDLLRDAGERGRRLVVANKGAARRYADMIREVLPRSSFVAPRRGGATETRPLPCQTVRIRPAADSRSSGCPPSAGAG